MKKAISIFAALLMLLSIVSVAFAQDAATEGAAVVEDAPAEITPAETTDTAGDTLVVAEQPEVVVVSDEAQAQEVIAEDLATPEVVEEAGVTPDQTILWGAEQVIEDVSLALTFDETAKAEKSLEYADERLAEAQVMTEENKTEAVETALEAQEENLADAEQAASEISSDDPEEELALQAEIQSKFQAQYEHTAQVKGAILARMQSKWSPEKYAKISANFDRMLVTHREVKAKIELNQEKTKTKLQAKTGKSSEEVENITKEIKSKANAENKVKTQIEAEEGQEKEESVKAGAGIVNAKGKGKE